MPVKTILRSKLFESPSAIQSIGGGTFPSLGGPNSFVDLILNSQMHSAMQFSRASGGETELVDGVFSQAAVNEARYKWVAGKRGVLEEDSAVNMSSDLPQMTKSAGNTAALTGLGDGMWRIVSAGQTGGGWAFFSVALYGLAANFQQDLAFSAEIFLESSAGAELLCGSRIAPVPYTSSTKNIFSSLKLGEWVKVDVLSSSMTDQYGAVLGAYFAMPVASITFKIRKLQVLKGVRTSSFIPTAGSPASRAPDLLTINTSAFGFNPSEGAFVIDSFMRATKAPNRWQCVLSVTDDVMKNTLNIWVDPDGYIGFQRQINGVKSERIGPVTAKEGLLTRFVAIYNDAGIRLFYDGQLIFNIAQAGRAVGLSKLMIGNNLNNDKVIDLTTCNVRYLPRSLSDTEALALGGVG